MYNEEEVGGAFSVFIHRRSMIERAGLYRLLHEMLRTDQLTGCSHTGVDHAHRHWQSIIEVLAHVVWQVSVFRVGGLLLERAKLIFAFIIFLFSTVASIWSIWTITAIVCPLMSNGEKRVSMCNNRLGIYVMMCDSTRQMYKKKHTGLSCLIWRRPCYNVGRYRVFLGYVFSHVCGGGKSAAWSTAGQMKI